MASADILRAARARIEDPKNWTTKELAQDAIGRPVRGMDASACKWCAVGALEAVGADPCGDEREVLSLQAMSLFDAEGIVDVNDRLGHEAVLAVYRAAIAAAEAEAGR